MAQQLVSAMTGEFDPSQYKDEYREALETIIQAKVEGEETVDVEAPEESGKLIDLMAALEASVNAAKASRSEPTSVADAKAAKEAKAERKPRRPARGPRSAEGREWRRQVQWDGRQGRSDEEADGETREACGPEAQDRLTPGRRVRPRRSGGRSRCVHRRREAVHVASNERTVADGRAVHLMQCRGWSARAADPRSAVVPFRYDAFERATPDRGSTMRALDRAPRTR